MSKEIVKYTPETKEIAERIEKWRKEVGLPAAEPRPPLRAALPPALPSAKPNPAQTAARPAAETLASILWALPETSRELTSNVIDLPRVCAVKKKLWTARHFKPAGQGFHTYLRSNVAESWRIATYAGPENWGLPPTTLQLGIELCPHCGAYTRDGSLGSVWCPNCDQFVCYGLTTPQGYFTCQCGHSGWLVRGNTRRDGFR
jgi:hypothetical protein